MHLWISILNIKIKDKLKSNICNLYFIHKYLCIYMCMCVCVTHMTYVYIWMSGKSPAIVSVYSLHAIDVT